jgi:RNA polymerase sigma factor (sigma-70 family)
MKKDVTKFVIQAQAGDINAFEKLVETFQDAIFGAAWTVVRNFHDAEDIAQETFVLAYQKLPRLREPEKFPGWLRQLTRTACNRFLRSRKADQKDISDIKNIPSDLSGPDAVVEGKELKENILKEISALSEKNRLVTTLYFINGYSHNEIGSFLEVPVSTVKSRLHESRKQLQGRLMKMAKDILHENKPGAEFIQELKKKLNGQIIELPDGRMQVFYDFVNEKELKDWRVYQPYEAAPKIKEKGLVFGRIEPEDTKKQFDRDICLNLSFDIDLQAELEINFDVIMGTCEPWTSVGWGLSKKGYGSRFFHGALTDWSKEWRQERNQWTKFAKEGHLAGDFLRRGFWEDKCYEEGLMTNARRVVPTQVVPISDSYNVKIKRHNLELSWEINGQTIGETKLTDEELCVTEHLILFNYGKGTGAIFKNIVIRFRILDVDSTWPYADQKKVEDRE